MTVKGINLADVRVLPVPVPPKATQCRLADILDKADAIRCKRQEAITLNESLLRSAFLEMFGDPVTNPKGWPTQRLGELAEFVGGGTPSRKRPEFFDGDVCWATSKDMKGEELDGTQEHITQDAIENSATKLVPPGVILVVVKSEILMRRLPVLVSKVPTCFGQDLKAIVPTQTVDAIYLARHLRVGQSSLLSRARGVNIEGLTLEHLREYQVVMPPDSDRKRFSELEAQIKATLLRQRASLAEAECLFGAIVQRAFRGDLTG